MFKFCIIRTNTQFYVFLIQKTKKSTISTQERSAIMFLAFVLVPVFNLDF